MDPTLAMTVRVVAESMVAVRITLWLPGPFELTPNLILHMKKHARPLLIDAERTLPRNLSSNRQEQNCNCVTRYSMRRCAGSQSKPKKYHWDASSHPPAQHPLLQKKMTLFHPDPSPITLFNVIRNHIHGLTSEWLRETFPPDLYAQHSFRLGKLMCTISTASPFYPPDPMVFPPFDCEIALCTRAS